MIKKNFVLAIFVFALFATGAVHADIASTKYVSDNALDSVEVFNITDDRDFTAPYITGGTLYLPTAWGNSDEIDPGLAVLASSDEGYQFATDDYGYNEFSIAPTVDYMKDSIRNTFAQNAIWVSPCDDPESEDCVTSAAGVIKGVLIGRGSNNYDSVPAQILDGVIEIPLANDHESIYAPGVVRVANDSGEYDDILETFDPDREFGVVGSTVPTVEYMQSEIEKNKTKVDTALSTTSTNPVQNKVVTSALNSKAAGAEYVEPLTPEYSFSTTRVLTVENGKLRIPYAYTNGEDASAIAGVVYVANNDNDEYFFDEENAFEEGEFDMKKVVPGINYMNEKIAANKLTQGTNVTISNNTINVATANATTAGVAEWGTVPAGSATSTTSAKIWIE